MRKKEDLYVSDRPAFLFDVAAIETWLEDWARRGYHLVRFRGMRGEFVWGPTAPWRYRLQPMKSKNEQAAPAMVEAYGEMGWEYVTSLGKVFHVWRSGDPDTPELDTDPVVQGMGYRYLKRRMSIELVVELLLLLVLYALIVWQWTDISSVPLLDIITRTVPGSMLLWGVVMILGIFLAVQEVLVMRRLLRRLDHGIPLDRPAAYRWKCWGHKAVIGLWILILFIRPNGLFFGGDFSRDLKDPESVVHVDLCDLEPGQTEEAENWYAKQQWQELAPLQTRSGQATDTSQISTDRYQLRWAKLAPKLVEDLLYRSGSPVRPFTRLESDQFDQLWWQQTKGGWQNIVASSGREVFHISYCGPVDLRLQADVLTKSLLSQIP